MHSSILLFGVLALAVVQQVTALPAPHQDGERAVKRDDDDGRGFNRDIVAALVNAQGNDIVKDVGPLSVLGTGDQEKDD
ncbi:predicted protein [Lichtheimia corymbifera JMRC:FSU:9682]|uniref:Uncharacterized protein n=1 Tax=Lichtheimia corymbifera JMRC:FSU:9682 TaxID=1263082 RepID=A0A068RUY4_9FUNG|nr:predicted protein [Lichtheimia corymbifera JMRC:FSU:9682]